MEPTTSASRIFVATAHRGQHMDLPLYSDNVEKFNTASQIVASNASEVFYFILLQSSATF